MKLKHSETKSPVSLRFSRSVCVLSAGLALVLTGCGGGGGGDSASAESTGAVAASADSGSGDLLAQARVSDVTNVVTAGDVTSTPPSVAAAVQPVTLQASDVIVALRPGQVGEVSAGRLQCMGQNVNAASVSGGVYGLGAGGLTELKHGVVDDVSGGNSSNKSLYFKVWKGDPNTSGTDAQRCERYFAGASETIPQKTDVWFGVRAKVSEWGASTYRVIWQWHDSNAGAGLLPHLAAIANGRNLRIIAQYNDSGSPTRDTTTGVVLFSTDQWQPNAWNDFVIKANVDPSAQGAGFVQAWLNGVKVVDYQGPFGYKYDNPADYAKVGLYHWNSTTNQWRAGDSESIEASYAGVVLLKHREGYGAEFVRGLMQ